jgi:hypothetical protein
MPTEHTPASPPAPLPNRMVVALQPGTPGWPEAVAAYRRRYRSVPAGADPVVRITVDEPR